MRAASIIGAVTELPAHVYSAEQVRALDRIAIDELGIPGYELMSRAGAAALDVLRGRWPEARSMVICCGAGNNAGDGYVLARLASDAGLGVRVIAVVAPERLTGDAARAWEDYRSGGGRVEPLAASAPFTEDILVDALLGTGLDRELSGDFAAVVTAINAAGRPVLALDIPTGLDADRGWPLGVAVRADVTVTFVGLKQGLFLGSAAEHRGELAFFDLGIPAEACHRLQAPLERLTLATLDRALPRRRRAAHKGSHGSLLLVGGCSGMAGAIRLAAEGALRAGAGLVRVATQPESVAHVMAGRAEVMCQGIAAPEELDPLIAACDGIVLGPGLGRSEWALAVWQKLLQADRPLVLDADGLNLLGEHPRRRADWLLTPHPGEAARLLGSTANAVQADRLGSVRQLAERFDAVTVLKGAGTLVAEPGHTVVAVCDRGNPGMATAGMGDVLAGVLGALLVQTGDLALSARAGVLLHASAGDDAAVAGERGLVAGDLMPHIRQWANLS